MIEFEVTCTDETLKDFQTLITFSKMGFTGAAFPNLANAFSNAQHIIKNTWTDYLNGENVLDIPNIDNVNRSMIDSIKEKTESDFHRSVYSDSKQMEQAVQGSPSVDYDMKKTHPYGRKSRVSNKGIPYLIIPFRWGTPNDKGTKRRWNNFIPQKEYEVNVLPLDKSIRTAITHGELNYNGQMIERSEYKWKGRLKDGWNDRSSGMVRMKDGTKSTYFTFRIISAKSPKNSWLYHRDGKAGVDIVGAIERKLKEPILNSFEKALNEDIKSLI